MSIELVIVEESAVSDFKKLVVSELKTKKNWSRSPIHAAAHGV
jgi:hypothetical protein